MCGRFVLNSTAEEVAAFFGLESHFAFLPRFNIAPTQEVPVVRCDASGARALAPLRWGLIPSWAKDPSIGNRLINARGETVGEKPAFRSAFGQRRCLVPATGFYEWKGKAGAKRPYLFRPVNEPLIALAGLWESWRPKDAAPVESFTIITTEANSAVRSVHHRMPVILEPRDFSSWLDPAEHDAEVLQPLLVPSPPDSLACLAVDPRVNDARVDDPACLQPASD